MTILLNSNSKGTSFESVKFAKRKSWSKFVKCETKSHSDFVSATDVRTQPAEERLPGEGGRCEGSTVWRGRKEWGKGGTDREGNASLGYDLCRTGTVKSVRQPCDSIHGF